MAMIKIDETMVDGDGGWGLRDSMWWRVEDSCLGRGRRVKSRRPFAVCGSIEIALKTSQLSSAMTRLARYKVNTKPTLSLGSASKHPF